MTQHLPLSPCKLCGKPAPGGAHLNAMTCWETLQERIKALEAGMDEGKRSILAELHNERMRLSAAQDRVVVLQAQVESFVAGRERDVECIQALRHQVRKLHAAMRAESIESIDRHADGDLLRAQSDDYAALDCGDLDENNDAVDTGLIEYRRIRTGEELLR